MYTMYCKDVECIADNICSHSLRPCQQLQTLSITLNCDVSGDEENYVRAIQDALGEYHMPCAVTFNGQDVRCTASSTSSTSPTQVPQQFQT